MSINDLTYKIIGAAIEVHRELGPGKAEIAYERALAHELSLRQLACETQKPVPVVYKGIKLECGYRLDLLVSHIVVVEVKSVEAVIPVHKSQVITYLKLGGWHIGLLINFNVAVLKQGIDRLIWKLEEEGKNVIKPKVPPQKTATTEPVYDTNSGDPEAERLANEVIDAAMEVHSVLGPGLLFSAYEICLAHELSLRGLPVERKRALALIYKGMPLPVSDEVNLLVGGKLVVQPHAVSAVEPVHKSALLSQLRLGAWRLGLLINFNTVHLTEGMHRVILSR